jgi:membrane associated rhomboid family serine protease
MDNVEYIEQGVDQGVQHAQEFGDLLTGVDWSVAGPKLAIACVAILTCMFLGTLIIRATIKFILILIIFVLCSIMCYLILSNQVTSNLEIAYAAAVLGAAGAVAAIPLLALKKKK